MSHCEDPSSCPILVHILYFSNTFTKKNVSGYRVPNIQGDRIKEGNQLGGYCNNLVRKVVVWTRLEAMEGGEGVKTKTHGKG